MEEQSVERKRFVLDSRNNQRSLLLDVVAEWNPTLRQSGTFEDFFRVALLGVENGDRMGRHEILEVIR